MAFEVPGAYQYTFVAAADLSTHQYKFVKLDANGKIVLVAAITDLPIGILQDNPVLGAEGCVMLFGISFLVSSATIATAAQLGTSANGRGAAIVPGTDTTQYKLGQVLEGAAANEILTVSFNCVNAARAA